MWSQLHVYTEQTGATGLKNNQKGVNPRERAAKRAV